MIRALLIILLLAGCSKYKPLDMDLFPNGLMPKPRGWRPPAPLPPPEKKVWPWRHTEVVDAR